jgi:acetylornithine deacetylase/succinyl-diaminopimelate desuccinylase-like protein
MLTEKNSSVEQIKKLINQNKAQWIKDYYSFLQFQSISTDPHYKPQVLACADWVANYLEEMGFSIELWQTEGHPVIYGSHLKAGSDKPTLLIYNHYDVQPVDPLEEWISPPFEPTLRDGQVYARGAQDNKGQCFYVLQALKLLLEINKSLPLNIKLCIEGEEECGSAGLGSLLKNKKEELKADYLVVVDVGLQDPSVPAVTIGVRGLISMDVEAEGTKTDLHSGVHGGLAYNPIHALVEILSKLRNNEGKIVVPGFYDDIVEMTPKERAEISVKFDQKKYENTFGRPPTGGEIEISPMERTGLRPTIEINGISGGYAGKGFKTVIPAKAHAKISCRLVPGQNPEKIGILVANFLEKQAPNGISAKVNVHKGKGEALRASPHSVVVQSFAKAFEEIFQKSCEFILEGASIPIVTELARTSESEVVLVGLGLGDDQIHAPNEHFGLDRIEKGIVIIVRALEILGNLT